jgi:Ca2+-binding RTX toxin-like protein
MVSRMLRAALVGGGCALGIAVAPAAASAASTVSYTPSPGGSSLGVSGEANQDNVAIFVDANTVTIADSGPGGITTADTDCSNVAGVVACPLDPPDPAPPAEPNIPVQSASISLQASADSFAPGTPVPFFLSVNGGEGEDTVTGGPRADSLDGGTGNDLLFGGDGNDDMTGGGNNFSTGGIDLIDGQGGTDALGISREQGVNVSLNEQADDGFPGEGDNVVVEQVISFGNGDDVLTGNAQANLLDGGAGNDSIRGLEGNDQLFGGSGGDGIEGGLGRDQIGCEDDFDVAVVDPSDLLTADCERTGAEVRGGTATINKKSKTKVAVECPVEEANQCDGSLVLVAGSKELGSASFSVGAGATGNAKPKLNQDGRKLLDKNGGTLLVSAEARTTEPIGTSVDADEVLLRRKPGKGGK